MRDLLDPKNTAARVEYAARVMLRGGSTSRDFDGCFEMGDGDMVAARLYRRALKNPRLMEVLPRYLVLDSIRGCYERIFGGGTVTEQAE